jgi:hypothetical protein
MGRAMNYRAHLLRLIVVGTTIGVAGFWGCKRKKAASDVASIGDVAGNSQMFLGQRCGVDYDGFVNHYNEKAKAKGRPTYDSDEIKGKLGSAYLVDKLKYVDDHFDDLTHGSTLSTDDAKAIKGMLVALPEGVLSQLVADAAMVKKAAAASSDGEHPIVGPLYFADLSTVDHECRAALDNVKDLMSDPFLKLYNDTNRKVETCWAGHEVDGVAYPTLYFVIDAGQNDHYARMHQTLLYQSAYYYLESKLDPLINGKVSNDKKVKQIAAHVGSKRDEVVQQALDEMDFESNGSAIGNVASIFGDNFRDSAGFKDYVMAELIDSIYCSELTKDVMLGKFASVAAGKKEKDDKGASLTDDGAASSSSGAATSDKPLVFRKSYAAFLTTFVKPGEASRRRKEGSATGDLDFGPQWYELKQGVRPASK